MNCVASANARGWLRRMFITDQDSANLPKRDDHIAAKFSFPDSIRMCHAGAPPSSG
jgi:hypothetical protein